MTESPGLAGGTPSIGASYARSRAVARAADQRGQALMLMLGVMLAVIAGAALLGAIASGLGAQQEHRGAADLAALAGAETMRVAQPRLFEPAELDRGVATRDISNGPPTSRWRGVRRSPPRGATARTTSPSRFPTHRRWRRPASR